MADPQMTHWQSIKFFAKIACGGAPIWPLLVPVAAIAYAAVLVLYWFDSDK